ncbi:hypothetical protein [Streptomyces sp. ISL-12]|uniref:hypothetical protein n=1 Tax=Streptomyces sp. ISL-12 TaxID=2819177 RepID=UPI0020357A90|nr:hypothetical protein [Streptomyces sp. ISL-12]
MFTVALAGVTVVVTMESHARRLERRMARLEEELGGSPERRQAPDDSEASTER